MVVKDKIENDINTLYMINRRKNEAKKVLEKAREMEFLQSKKPIRLNSKTIVLR